MASEDKDLFAPPTKAELAEAKTEELAPPTPEELAAVGVKPKPNMNKAESILAGIGNGGTLGFAPRIGAAAGSLASMAQQKLAHDPQPQSLSDLYNEYLAHNKKYQTAAQESNPNSYMGGQVFGGVFSPVNKIGGVFQAGKAAPMISRMAAGAGNGALIGSAAGLSNSDDLTDLKQDAKQVAHGAEAGAEFGALAVPVVAGSQKLLGGASSAFKSFAGNVGKRFQQGLEHGQAGEFNLATPEGQQAAMDAKAGFATNTVDSTVKGVADAAKAQAEAIKAAKAAGLMANKGKISDIAQKILQTDPDTLNSSEARAELQHLKGVILDALEGPEKEQVVRMYGEQVGPRPVPGETPIEPAPPARDVSELEREVKEANPAPKPDAEPLTSVPPDEPVSEGPNNEKLSESEEPLSPNGFAGYEKIHAQTVDPTDPEALASFKQRVAEKLADERALGKNSNSNPIEVHQEPIPGTDKHRLVAKRAVMDEDANAFKDQAEALEDRQKSENAQAKQTQKEQDRLQSLLDRQEQEKIKMQSQQDAEMAKNSIPKDETVVSRPGNRQVEQIDQAKQLQTDLSNKGKFGASPYSTDQARNMAGEAADKLNDVVKDAVPGIEPINNKIHALNNIGERLGIDMQKIKLPNGEGEAERQKAVQKVMNIIQENAPEESAVMAQKAQDFVAKQLESIDPQLSATFRKEVARHAQNSDILGDLTKDKPVGSLNYFQNFVRKQGTKLGYGAGYSIGSEVAGTKKLMQPAVDATKQVFTTYTPEAMQSAAKKAAASLNPQAQKFGKVLEKLAASDNQTRNSTMFVLQQQPGYRSIMDRYFTDDTDKAK